MKIPKKTRRFCRFCGKQTEQKITLGKTGGKRPPLKSGSRRHERRSGIHGYGGQPRALTPPKSKTSKRTPIIYQCSVCKKKYSRKYNIRLKKLQQV